MLQKGKTDNVLKEMTRMKIKKLGILEIRCGRNGDFRKNGFYVAYHGNDDHIGGVGIIVPPSMASQVRNTWATSDRVIVTKVKNLYQSFCISQCYAPTCDKEDPAVDRFYGQTEKAPKKVKYKESVFVMGDFNAKAGNLPEKPVVDPDGLGNGNDKGDKLVDWCQINSFSLCSTMFQKLLNKQWTWQTPNGVSRNQIDYVRVKFQNRNSILYAWAESDAATTTL